MKEIKIPSTQGQRAQAQLWRTSALDLMRKPDHADLEKALDLLQRSARLFSAQKLYSDEAADYLAIGEVYVLWGRYAHSIQAYQFGLQKNKNRDSKLSCSLLSHLAIAAMAKGDSGAAQHYASRAMAAATVTGDQHCRAEALEASGEANLYSSFPDKTLSRLAKAIVDSRSTGDKNLEARAHLNSGYVLFQAGSVPESIAEQSKALELWKHTGNIHDEGLARAALGLLFAYIGEPARSATEYQKALQIFSEVGDLDNEGATWNGLGFLARTMGDYENSTSDYRRAQAIFARLGDKTGEIGAMEGEALARLALHDPSAKKIFLARLHMSTRLGNSRLQASELSELADIYETTQPAEQTESLYKRSVNLCHAARYALGEIEASIKLAHFYISRGRNEKAVGLLHHVQRFDADALGSANQARTRYELARAYYEQAQYENAQKENRSAIEIIEQTRAKPNDFETRASYFASVHRYYQLLIDILMRLEQQHPDKGFAQKAFEAAEQGKVRSLLDRLAASNAEGCLASDEPTAVSSESQSGGTHGNQVANCFIPAKTALSLTQVQAEIDHDAVLLEYEVGDTASYLWAVDSTGLSVLALPASDRISALVRKLRKAVAAPQTEPGGDGYLRRIQEADEEYRKDAAELFQMVLAPAWSHLQGKKNVLIVPDGPLQFVPFSALAVPGNGDPAFDTLSRHFESTNLPSASTLEAIRNAPARHSQPTLMAAVFADPVFSGDDSRLTQKSLATKALPSPALSLALKDSGLEQKLPRLPASKIEAENIRKIFAPAPVFTALDFDADRDTVMRADLGSYRYLHFAVHGIMDARHPELSGLVFSLVNSKGEAQDGYLRLGDIYRLRLAADLVVLSSCNSALGKDMESEGIVGLPYAFLNAGAKRIISTLWNVDDAATARFMERFYHYLHDGQSPASALRNAQSDIANAPVQSSPYYWGGFVLQGEYR
jgi:CHAT domain-containing protein